MHLTCQKPALYVCLLFTLIPELSAQQSAAIFGQVLDPSKAMVVGASVRVTDLERGAKRNISSNGTGSYVFDPLEPGEYSLLIQSKGFADLRIERIAVKARNRFSLRNELVLAATNETVTVESSALENLPLNGRTVQALLTMAPGVTPGVGPGGEIHSNGLRSNTNYYMLDGVSLSGGGGMGGMGGMGGGSGLN